MLQKIEDFYLFPSEYELRVWAWELAVSLRALLEDVLNFHPKFESAGTKLPDTRSRCSEFKQMEERSLRVFT